MSKYLRCFVILFCYLFLFELALFAVFSLVVAEPYALFDAFGLIIGLSWSGFLSWLALQLLIAYLLCALLARTDSTSVSHYMFFAALVGTLIAATKFACLVVTTPDGLIYLTLVPIVIAQFAVAGYLFAKLQ